MSPEPVAIVGTPSKSSAQAMDIGYPNAKQLRKACMIGRDPAIFYTRPGTRVAGQAFGALVGGKTVDQVFRRKLIQKITLYRTESEDKAWWQFVGIFSKVFAEAARGQSFLVSAVPYIGKNDSIFERIGYPALKRNLKVTKVTCVDVHDYSKREVLFVRGGGANGQDPEAGEFGGAGAGAIIIDKVDALCGPREEGESEASRRIKTELLVKLDGVGQDSTGVLIPAVTNIPWQLDAAIRRRFQGRIHINLPDLRGRIDMFKMPISTTPYAVSPEELGKMTEGYSGSDIAIAVQDVLRQPVRKIPTSEHYKKVRRKLCLVYLEEHGLLFESRSLLKALRSLEEAQ